MRESFGVRMRREREGRKIALATIAEQTKIKLSLFEGLEQDDVSQWPTGIFRRAFIRAYALAIGLDQDVVVREFLEVHPDPIEVVEPVDEMAARVDVLPKSSAPPTRFRYLVGSAVARLRRGNDEKQKSSSTVEVTEPDVRSDPQVCEPDLAAIAHLCTEFSRLDETAQSSPLIQEAARILGAVGLIVWVWDPKLTELKPAIAHGYPDAVLAQLPRVKREADNATAAAFRSAQTCAVRSRERVNGALAVPLMTPVGCAGVLAVELKDGAEQQPTIRALAVIFAAQLARLVEVSRSAGAADRRLA